MQDHDKNGAIFAFLQVKAVSNSVAGLAYFGACLSIARRSLMPHSAFSSSSSGEEKARLEACQSVCESHAAEEQRLSSHRSQGKRRVHQGKESLVADAFKLPPTYIDHAVTAGVNGEGDAFQQRAACVLDAHMNSTLEDINGNDDGVDGEDAGHAFAKDVPATLDLLLPEASLQAERAVRGFRLFSDSQRGVVRVSFPRSARKGGRISKRASRTRAAGGNNEGDSEADESERFARAKAVSVDNPPPPARSRPVWSDKRVRGRVITPG